MSRQIRVSALLFLMTVTLVAAGTEEPEPLSLPFVEREQVRFVTLDVVVDHRENRRWGRATDLQTDSLELRIDGKPVELELFENRCPAGDPGASEFSAVGDDPMVSAPVVATTSASTGPVTRGARANDVEPTRFVLYFELMHLKHESVRLSHKAARRWAQENIRRSDEVMLITGSRVLKILRPMGPAGQDLLEAIDGVLDEYVRSDSWANWEDPPLGGRIPEIKYLLKHKDTESMGKSLATNYATMDHRRTRRTLRNLESLMAVFDSLEGTKNLVLFQDTIRLLPGHIYPAADFLSDVHRELNRLALAANERNVRIYPVDGAGLRIRGGIDSAMTMLATETGGRWLEGTNDLGTVFEHAREDMECFYRVGFRTRSREDGRRQAINVQITEKGAYRTRHRRTLYHATAKERRTSQLRAALLDPTTATSIPVTFNAVTEGGEGLHVEIRADLEAVLSVRSTRDMREARLQIGASIIPHEGTDGEPVHFAQGAVLRIPTAGALPAYPLLAARDFELPPGSYHVVVVVQDQLADVVGAASGDVVIAAPQGEANAREAAGTVARGLR